MTDQEMHPGTQAMAGGSHGFLARTYFRVKPYIPNRIRWTLRRIRIPRIMRRSAGLWPINESAAEKPAGWCGWPDGKRFALVFTHDVESESGLRNVRALADLEIRHNICSSFNFIPEGPYADPAELRKWLDRNGFEVGVHDLNHDGHLYESREGFSEKAERINRHLANWGAVGFRSGFMLRQLDWLHELNLLYDTSTFDTDPFEPQPDGSQTIFPFHVKPGKAGSRPGYVELSYTLPQDSTLFLLLREETPEIWMRKLDWIVNHGGLALVNIHPDYIDFTNGDDSRDRYPVSILKEFLEYIESRYQGQYWNPLARNLASWYWSQTKPGESLPPKFTPTPPPTS